MIHCCNYLLNDPLPVPCLHLHNTTLSECIPTTTTNRFHGTAPDVIPKICSQGFNRSFCGKNAVVYGKGVYFANNSFYSNRYAHVDSKGVQRMFLCRVAVGEFCLGHNGQLAPDVRDNKRNLLYDSTTDNMDEKKRDMFVTYHDAQVNKNLTLYVLTIPLK